MIVERKADTLKEIHLAAELLLNPTSLRHELSRNENFAALEFIYNTAKNMDLDDAKVLADLANYQNREGIWTKQFIWMSIDNFD